MIPFTMLLYVMTTKEAICLTSFALICTSLARFLQTFNDGHPEKDACVIDYNIATVMMPAVLLGSFIGAFLNIIMPTLIILIALTVILFAMAIQAGIKYVQIYRKETV